MSKPKSLKQKFLQLHSENNNTSSMTSPDRVVLDESQVIQLTQWLEQLNREKLIMFTDQNDLVIMPAGKNDQAQQIFINFNDINVYMKAKTKSNKVTDEVDIIDMVDIARMLLKFGYVTESSGQLSFKAQTMTLDSNELTWLISIVRDVRLDQQTYETHVQLFDGESTQLLCIPYEHMTPTTDVRTVATYLFQNGQVRYDVDSGTYIYRYIEPDVLLDEKIKSPERISQHHLLSFHIRRIHVDERNKRIEVEFLYEPIHRLVLPIHWYHRALNHRFDREYIIEALLANGGIVNRDNFIFMNQVYSLQEPRKMMSTSLVTLSTTATTVNLSWRQKYDLIRHYIDFVIEKDCTKQDETAQLFVLENPVDDRLLYFTPEHSQFIRQNQFRRQDVIHILVKNSQIKQDEVGHWLLYYNKQHIRLPPSLLPSSIVSSQGTNNLIRPQHERISVSMQEISRPMTTATSHDTDAEFRKRYHTIIDYMCRHGLVTWDKHSELIRLHFTDQTLLLPLDHLRSIVDPSIVSSSSTIDGVLPFKSRQLSQWLLNNSYIKRNSH